MATITLMESAKKIDGSLKKDFGSFMLKLQENPASSSLHIEPLRNVRDTRIRTGRVTQKFRAILFELTAPGTQHFIVVGVYGHDEAYRRAPNMQLTTNQINGLAQLIEDTTPEPAPTGRHAAPEPAQQEVPHSESPAATFHEAGITPSLLQERTGLDPEVSSRVLSAGSEAEFEKELDGAPKWAHDLFLGLATGSDLDSIIAELSLDQKVEGMEDHDRDSDAAILQGLQHPAAKMEFYYAGDDAQVLRRVIEDDSFENWTIFLHPNQRHLVDKSFNGPARVFGGAGTGKTVVALHRANHLVTAPKHTPAVLLTTYTRALADALESQMERLNSDYPAAAEIGSPGLWIGGIDQAARNVVAGASAQERRNATEVLLGAAISEMPKVMGSRETEQAWSEAIDVLDERPEGEAGRPDFLNNEYEAVVLAQGISSRAEYLSARRTGRGLALNRSARKQVWSAVEAFCRRCASHASITWAQLAALAAQILRARSDQGQGYLFDHVIVDEAQDFHPGHWLFLRASVAQGPNDLFIAEDGHQRIDGQKLTLNHFDIETRGRSRRLTLNYRTTKENLDYAVSILTGEEWTDAEGDVDSTAGYRSLRTGPDPTVIVCDNEREELENVTSFVRTRLEETPNAHIGVLSRTKSLVDRVTDALGDANVPVGAHDPTSGGHVEVMTMHKAKGMEFSTVVLVGVDNETAPLRYLLQSAGESEKDDVLQRERALLYVAASRARDELVVSTRQKKSPLLLP